MAVGLLAGAVEALGMALATAVTLLDVPLVVMGGGLADRLGPAFVTRVREATMASMPAGQSEVEVVAGALGDRGGALGAAVVAGWPVPPAAPGTGS